MTDTKKEVAPMAAETTSSNSSTTVILAQGAGKSQAGQTVPKKKKRSSRMLFPNSRTRTIAVKIYDEQMPFGIAYVISQIRKVDKTKIQIIFQMHNQDISEDTDLWLPSVEKRHYHLIGRGVGDFRFYVNSLLTSLGIVYRPGLDTMLWENRGVETVGDFTDYAVYLTHETPESMSNGGKFEYDLKTCFDNGFKTITSEADLNAMCGMCVSNLSYEELTQIREGYTRLDTSGHKLTYSDFVAMDKELFQLGYDFGNLDAWIDSQPWELRSNSKRKTLEESYFRGIEARVRDDRQYRRTVGRVCVFIQGDTGTGKSYAALHSFPGKCVLAVEGGGTGKFDDLRPYTDVIVINDDVLPNALNMADDYPCKAYKRVHNNQVWAGKYLIVTSNKNFVDWLADCGIHNHKHIEAMKERFFICHMERIAGRNYMRCDSIPSRGDVSKVQTILNRFTDFQKAYNSICSSYIPATEESLDMSALNAGVPDGKSIERAYNDWIHSCSTWCIEHGKNVVIGTPSFDDFTEHFLNDDEEWLSTITYREDGQWYKTNMRE